MVNDVPDEGEHGTPFRIPDEATRVAMSGYDDADICRAITLAFRSPHAPKEEVQEAIAFFAWELIRRVGVRREGGDGKAGVAQ